MGYLSDPNQYFIPGEFLLRNSDNAKIRYLGYIEHEGRNIMLGVHYGEKVIINPSEFRIIKTFMDFYQEETPYRISFQREDIEPMVKLGLPIVVFTLKDGKRALYAVFEGIHPDGFLEEFDEAIESNKKDPFGLIGEDCSFRFFSVTQEQKEIILDTVYNTKPVDSYTQRTIDSIPLFDEYSFIQPKKEYSTLDDSEE